MDGGFEHWLGVGDAMRAEAMEAAEAALESLAEDVEGVLEVRPELHLKEDELVKALSDLLEADPEIAILVVGAAPSGENARPACRRARQRPRPVSGPANPGHRRAGRAVQGRHQSPRLGPTRPT
jgi:hypothetical protein